MRAAGFRVVIATCIDRMSIDRVSDTYDLLKGLDIQSWRVAPPQERGNWRGTTTDVSLEEEMGAYAPLLGRWLQDSKPFFIQLAAFFRGVGKGGPDPGQEPELRHAPESYDCGACREKPYLLPDGTLLPCPGYTDTVLPDRMPNILREGLSKVWTESFLRSIANMKKSDLLPENKECTICGLFQDCGMGCRGSAVAETGDLMAKDPVACEMWNKGYKKRFRDLASVRR